MDTIIVGSGQDSHNNTKESFGKLKPSWKMVLASYNRSAKAVLLLAIVIVGVCLIVGGHWAATSLTVNLNSERASTATTASQTTTASSSSQPTTKVQADSTVGGTANPGTPTEIHSTGGTTTGSPPPLGSVYHNVVFVGDSITAGWINDGAHAYPILTISGLYGHNTGNAWYQLVKGRSGAISAGALLDLQTFGVQPKNANLMVVELGTNDMVHMSAATFKTNYQSLISYLIANSPNVQLVCLGPWRAATDNFGYDTTPAYESAAQSVCKDATNSTALYLDLSALYANKSYHNTTGDTFHPNNAGAQAIANEIVNAVYP